MAIPENKDELLKALQDNYSKLKKELLSVPSELTALPELEGHSKNTFMSVENLVAYLLGWARLVLKWHAAKSKALPVTFPDTGYKWNELGLLAQKFYSDYRDYSYETLIKKLDNTVHEILELIGEKSNEDLYYVDWYEKWTLGRMIQLNTSSPYKNATARIRKWKKVRRLL